MTVDTCGDDRFELIEEAKRRLIESTNIEDRPEEVAVLDSILFRCWQMGWLNQPLETSGAGTCEGSFHESSDLSSGRVPLYYCKGTNKSIFIEREARFCPLCGKRITKEEAE